MTKRILQSQISHEVILIETTCAIKNNEKMYSVQLWKTGDTLVTSLFWGKQKPTTTQCRVCRV